PGRPFGSIKLVAVELIRKHQLPAGAPGRRCRSERKNYRGNAKDFPARDCDHHRDPFGSAVGSSGDAVPVQCAKTMATVTLPRREPARSSTRPCCFFPSRCSTCDRFEAMTCRLLKNI